MRTLTYFAVIVLLVGCSVSEIDFERTSVIINEQKFEILTANEIYLDFITRKGNYSSDVFSLIEKEFLRNSEYPFILESIKSNVRPDDEINAFLKELIKVDFKKLIEPFLHIIISELPGSGTKILFIPVNPAHVGYLRELQFGISAITVGSGKIIISVDPKSVNWQKQLPYVLAHEYHHSVWTSRNFKTKEFTPLEYLIFEGRADSFAKRLFPDVNNPATKMFGKVEEERVWNILKPELYKRDTPMNDLMMTGNDEIPLCSGYTIGFNIVEAFKKNNPDVGDSVLIDLDPEIILKMSLYDN